MLIISVMLVLFSRDLNEFRELAQRTTIKSIRGWVSTTYLSVNSQTCLEQIAQQRRTRTLVNRLALKSASSVGLRLRSVFQFVLGLCFIFQILVLGLVVPLQVLYLLLHCIYVLRAVLLYQKEKNQFE